MTPWRPETHIFFHSKGFDRMAERSAFPSCFTYEIRVWLGAESNRRHVDFQSTALPTELPSRDATHRMAPWGFHYAAMSL